MNSTKINITKHKWSSAICNSELVKRSFAEDKVVVEVKEEKENEEVVVVEVEVIVALENHVCVLCVRNQRRHSKIGRTYAEREHVVVEPLVGNHAEDVNEYILYESGVVEVLARLHNVCELRLARKVPLGTVFGEDVIEHILREDVVVKAVRKETFH